MDLTEWMSDAKCKGKNNIFWFPPVDVPNLSQFFNVGRAVCDRCPVWDSCLELGREERWGMWGGLTPHERRFKGEPSAYGKPHATITRYRQGCRCGECMSAAAETLPTLDMDLLPGSKDPVDIDLVKQVVHHALHKDNL